METYVCPECRSTDLHDNGWDDVPGRTAECGRCHWAGKPVVKDGADEFNRKWVGYKNEFSRLEAEQEAKAFLAGP